jgi:phosphoribosylformylglycinamidine synthase
MALSSDHGMKLNLTNVPVSKNMKRNDYILFSESNSRFLVEVSEKRREDFEALMGKNVCSAIGRVEKNRRLSVVGLNGEGVVNASLNRLRNSWKSTFE